MPPVRLAPVAPSQPSQSESPAIPATPQTATREMPASAPSTKTWNDRYIAAAEAIGITPVPIMTAPVPSTKPSRWGAVLKIRLSGMGEGGEGEEVVFASEQMERLGSAYAARELIAMQAYKFLEGVGASRSGSIARGVKVEVDGPVVKEEYLQIKIEAVSPTAKKLPPSAAPVVNRRTVQQTPASQKISTAAPPNTTQASSSSKPTASLESHTKTAASTSSSTGARVQTTLIPPGTNFPDLAPWHDLGFELDLDINTPLADFDLGDIDVQIIGHSSYKA